MMHHVLRAARARPSVFAITIGAIALSACSTTSFAPPEVQVGRKIDKGRMFSCNQLNTRYEDKINRDVLGSIDLIDNFITAYRCASHEAADGRQIFEVPSMLALIAAGIGPAFGLTPDGALAAATGAAVYGRANSYYAPKEKAAVLDTALDAVLCVKAAAVGFDFFDTQGTTPPREAEVAAQEAVVAELSEDQRALETGLTQALAGTLTANKQRQDLSTLLTQKLGVAQLNANTLDRAAKVGEQQLAAAKEQLASLRSAISAPRRHYEMVSTALFAIERVLAQRLSNIGNFDSAGIAAEFDKLGGKVAKAEDKKDELTDGAAKKSDGTPLVRGAEFEKAQIEAELELMQSRLQVCVVRAKV